jgi:outer membrane lipoprotein-sorting protein
MKTTLIFSVAVTVLLANGFVQLSATDDAPPQSSRAEQPAPGAAAPPKAAANSAPGSAPASQRPSQVGPPATFKTASPAAAGIADPSTNILRACRERLTSVKSIKARVTQRVSIGGRRFRTEGSYAQGTDLRLRLEFKVQQGSGKDAIAGSFLEVCDGTVLWTRRQIGDQQKITRRDVRQILNAARTSGEPQLLTVELGLGGLPGLLAALERSMTFTPPTEQKINGKTFSVVAGKWNDSVLQRFKAHAVQKRLPNHIPDAARVYFEPELLFPRRIAFLKAASDGELEPMVEMDFLDITINAEIAEREFDFVPPDGVRTVDVTNEYLEQLKSSR